MNVQILYAAFLVFCAGLFLVIATRNILKIFIGTVLLYNASILILTLSGDAQNILMGVILSAFVLAAGFFGIFIITKIYSKFNTLDIKEIEKTAREEK